MLASNPAERIRLPRLDTPEASSWSAAETQQFIDVADEHPWRALWWTVIQTGLRNSEIRALRWEDIDLRTGIIKVHRKLDDTTNEIGQPKQHRLRSVAINGDALEALRDHRSAAGSLGWVFANDDGSPLQGRIVRRTFHELSAQAGVSRIRFHSLRHTAITAMLRAGVAVHIVARIAGHSKPSITSDLYAHVLTGDVEVVAERMAAFVRRPDRPAFTADNRSS